MHPEVYEYFHLLDCRIMMIRNVTKVPAAYGRGFLSKIGVGVGSREGFIEERIL